MKPPQDPQANALLDQMWRRLDQRVRDLFAEEFAAQFGQQFVGGKLDAGSIGGVVAPTALPTLGPSGTGHQAGIAPDPGAVAGTAKYLREDATWDVPTGSSTGTVTSVSGTAPVSVATGTTTPVISVPAFVASGASHAAGLVPDPGSSAGTTKFLREDATWQVPAGGGGGGQLFSLTTPPTAASWTWVNQGSSTVTDQTNGLTLANTATEGTWHLLVKSAPSTPYTIIAAFLLLSHNNAADEVGLAFRESSSGKCALADVAANATVYSRKLTSATSFSADYMSDANYNFYIGLAHGIVWLRIQDNGTNRICSYSADGQYWYAYHTIGRTDFLTADQVGWFIRANSNLVAATLISWAQT